MFEGMGFARSDRLMRHRPPSTSSTSTSLFTRPHVPVVCPQIASGLLSAGLGLILSTPGGSETEDNDAEPDEDADEVGVVAGVVAALALDRRRESAVSVASGIYEEIGDALDTPAGTPTVVIDRVYENAGPGQSAWPRRASSLYEDPALLVPGRTIPVAVPGQAGNADAESPEPEALSAVPPPLPPRQNLTPISELLTRYSRVSGSGSLSHKLIRKQGNFWNSFESFPWFGQLFHLFRKIFSKKSDFLKKFYLKSRKI